MDFVVTLALVVAVVLCTLPGILAWRFYSIHKKQVSEKRQAVRRIQTAEA